MKRMMILLSIVFVLFTSGCGNAVTNQETVQSGTVSNPNPFQTVVVTGRTVNLRQGPGTQYAVVGSASAGDSLMVTGEAPDWYRIYVPEKSLFAWIYAGLTSGAVMPR